MLTPQSQYAAVAAAGGLAALCPPAGTTAPGSARPAAPIEHHWLHQRLWLRRRTRHPLMPGGAWSFPHLRWQLVKLSSCCCRDGSCVRHAQRQARYLAAQLPSHRRILLLPTMTLQLMRTKRWQSVGVELGSGKGKTVRTMACGSLSLSQASTTVAAAVAVVSRSAGRNSSRSEGKTGGCCCFPRQQTSFHCCCRRMAGRRRRRARSGADASERYYPAAGMTSLTK